MEILQLVDQLEQVLNRGWRMPLTSSLVVNEEECLRLIDQMRISVPSAIKESERMIAERDRILEEAHLQAEEIIAQAEREAMEMVSEHHITQASQQEAERILERGQIEAIRMVQDAEDYTLTVLRDLSDQLSDALRQAENGIQAIEESRAAEEEMGYSEPAAPISAAEPENDTDNPDEA